MYLCRHIHNYLYLTDYVQAFNEVRSFMRLNQTGYEELNDFVSFNHERKQNLKSELNALLDQGRTT